MGKKKLVIILVAALLLLLAVGGILWMLLGGTNEVIAPAENPYAETLYSFSSYESPQILL